MLWAGTRSIFLEVAMVALMLGVVAAVIVVTRAQRRVPVQYPKRVIGRRIYGGQTTHLPLSVNSAGIIPIILRIDHVCAGHVGPAVPQYRMDHQPDWILAGAGILWCIRLSTA